MGIEQIVERLNLTRVFRIVDVELNADGRKKILLPSEDSIVIGFEADRHEASVKWQVNGQSLDVAVKTQGMHFLPQPWPHDEPINLKIILAVMPEKIIAPSNIGNAFSIQLPAGLEHVVQHNMGSTKFVESVVSIDSGEKQFALVQAIDDDNFRLTLTEPMAVQLSAIFVKEE